MTWAGLGTPVQQHFCYGCRILELEEILQSLTIRKIRARAVNVPLAKPHPTAGGNVVSAPLVLIDLETEQGVTGRTYLFCYTGFAMAPVVSLVESLGALVVGDALAPLEI